MADITVALTAICASNHPVFCGDTYGINCGCCDIIYTIRNICSLTYQMDSPVQIIPIPETQVNWTGTCPVKCEGAGPIALKIEGNQATVNIVWTINDEPTTVVNGGVNDNCTCNPFECVLDCPPDCMDVIGIRSAQKQVQFLLTAFQNRSIAYRYEYNGGGFSTVGCLLQKLTMTLEGRSPIIYRGEMTLAIGDTVTTVNE